MSAGLSALAVGLAILLAAPLDADARDRQQRRAFVREHPCPVTGKRSGPCPGWQVDHVIPLCAGGADHPKNMQWLTVRRHRIKTSTDLRLCHTPRRG